jgi:uncharacterized membrane protein YjjP (DUF1212 family)
MTANPSSPEHAAVTDMLTEASAALVSSTYPAPQADATISRLAHAYGAEPQVALLPTMVLSQANDTSAPRMRVVHTSFRFDQMVAAQSVISQAIAQKLNPAQVADSFRAIRTRKPLYSPWVRLLGYGLSSFGYGAVFRLDIPALIGAFVIGIVVGALVLSLSRTPRYAALLPLLATFAAGIMVAGAAIVFDRPDPVRLIALPVIILLPGAVITSSIIELVSGYMISGASRLIYSVMILATMAFGGSLAILASGLPGTRLEDITATMTPAWVAWAGVAIYGLGTFLYFCTPLHLWMPTLAVMLASFAISVWTQPTFGTPLSAGVATAFGLIAAWAINARLGGGPGDLAIFLPTFWLIVPGSTGFVAMTGAIVSSDDLSSVALTAALTFFSMAVGIMIASAVYPLLARIAPDTKLIMKRGAGLITDVVKR